MKQGNVCPLTVLFVLFSFFVFLVLEIELRASPFPGRPNFVLFKLLLHCKPDGMPIITDRYYGLVLKVNMINLATIHLLLNVNESSSRFILKTMQL